MTAEEITRYLTELNDELRLMDIKGEVSIYGGAVMCLAFKARPATKDVDAIFEPVREIRNAARRVAERNSLDVGWLNLAVKMFVVEHEKQVLFDFPNLKVFIPDPDYLLAMKLLSLRPATFDEDDIEFLLEKLNIQSAEEALAIIRDYYPKKEIKPATDLWLENYFSR